MTGPRSWWQLVVNSKETATVAGPMLGGLLDGRDEAFTVELTGMPGRLSAREVMS